MVTEFESMKNYWQQKLAAEREYYEELRKENNLHCQELELRIKKVEILRKKIKSDTSDTFGKLRTIEEQRLLEDWEEEVPQLKIKMETVKKDHEDEIIILKQELQKVANCFDGTTGIKCSWCKTCYLLSKEGGLWRFLG